MLRQLNHHRKGVSSCTHISQPQPGLLAIILGTSHHQEIPGSSKQGLSQHTRHFCEHPTKTSLSAPESRS